MPEITIFGWFHTGVGILALITGVYSLVKFKVIQPQHLTSKIYLICTLIAAVTALAIFRRGEFGPAHALAVLTLLALLVGGVASKTEIFGKFSPYIQATSFSATFLFHMIPAITDGLLRLPVNSPVITKIDDPLLLGFYLAFLLIYLIGLVSQFVWLHRRNTGP